MRMLPQNITGRQVLSTAQTVGVGSLRAYKAVLRTKLLAADMAIKGLEGLKPSKQSIIIENQKENKNMKGFLTAATLLAVTGAALGAAGYYLYKKEKELSEYEDILFNDQLMNEYEISVVDEIAHMPETDEYVATSDEAKTMDEIEANAADEEIKF